MPSTKPLTIGKLALETGVKVVTIRYYEQIGLMPAAPRTDGNYRMYGEEHRRRGRGELRSRWLHGSPTFATGEKNQVFLKSFD